MGQSRELLEKFYADVDGGDYATAVTNLAEDVDWSWGGIPAMGRSQTREWLEAFGPALAPLKHTIITTVETGSGIAAEVSVTARHSGMLAMRNLVLPATGTNLVIPGCHIVEIDDDGLISLSHVYPDLINVLAQIEEATPASVDA